MAQSDGSEGGGQVEGEGDGDCTGSEVGGWLGKGEDVDGGEILDSEDRWADGIDKGASSNNTDRIIIIIDDEGEGTRIVVDGHFHSGNSDHKGGASRILAHVLDGEEAVDNEAVDLSRGGVAFDIPAEAVGIVGGEVEVEEGI